MCDGQVVPGISKDHSTCIFRVKQARPSLDEHAISLQDTGSYSHKHIVSHPRSLKFSLIVVCNNIPHLNLDMVQCRY
jgi:hypothetical protein